MSNNPPDDTRPLSRREEERLLRAGRSVFSTAFPNPNREGCPSQDLIESLARDKSKLAQHQDFILHMSRCSPCYNDFARFRRAAQRERRLKAVGIAALVVLVCLASWFVVRSRRHTVSTNIAVVLDLRNRLVLRGVPQEGEQAQQPLMLLRGIDDVSLYLPTGSRTGTYDLAVFQEPGTPVVSATGDAIPEGSLTVLKAKLNVSKLNSGHYLLAIRPPGVDWSYYPLEVR